MGSARAARPCLHLMLLAIVAKIATTLSTSKAFLAKLATRLFTVAARPSAKIRFSGWSKPLLEPTPSRLHKRGTSRSSRTRGAGCGRRRAVLLKRAPTADGEGWVESSERRHMGSIILSLKIWGLIG